MVDAVLSSTGPRTSTATGVGLVLAVALVGAATAAAPLPDWSRSLGVAGVVVAAMVVTWTRPVYAVLGVAFLMSRVVAADAVDVRLPIGGGLELPDLAFLGTLAVLAVRELAARRLRMPWWPVTLPLLVFLGLATFSVLYAVLAQNVAVYRALSEFRPLVFYASCLLVVWCIRTPRDRWILVTGLFLVADATVILILIQQFVGAADPIVSAMGDRQWHVWAERTVSGSLGGVRVVPPAHVLLHLLVLVGFAGLVTPGLRVGRRVFFGAHVLILSTGLVLTYTRAQWIVGGLGVGVILLVMARRLALGAACAGVAVAALVLLHGAWRADVSPTRAAPFVEVLTKRVGSIFAVDATARSYSLQWRDFEREEAQRSMAAHPLLGVGLGNAYRRVSIVLGESHFTQGMWPDDRTEGTRYLHNSYLAIVVKMGWPALLAYLWFCAAFVVAGVIAWQGLPAGEARSGALAVLTAFVGVLGWSVFHSHLVDDPSAYAIGVMVGLVARSAVAHGIDASPARTVGVT